MDADQGGLFCTPIHWVGAQGYIDNIVSEFDAGLQLAFLFVLVFPDTEPGSEEERGTGEEMMCAYMAAIGAAIAKVRGMAQSGTL